MCQIYEDRFLLEEGVCRWHMTDEKRNIDHKDIQIVQVIFNDYLISIVAFVCLTLNDINEDRKGFAP